MSEAEAKPHARRLTLRLILVITGVVLAVAVLALYAARRIIAREALTGWLRSKGIASEAEVKDFGFKSFIGRLRVGDPRNPDFTAEQAEVTYGLRGFGLEVTSVTLRRPVVRARVHDGKLSVGSLDPLIEEFRRRPPKPGGAKPRIIIDDGQLLLATDYGAVRLTADARVEQEKLVSLDASLAPTQLSGQGFKATLGPSVVTARTRGDRVLATVDAAMPEAEAGATRTRGARLRITADAPYPDLKRHRGDGVLKVQAQLNGRELVIGDQRLGEARLNAGFNGQSAGWISDLQVTGRAAADLQAGSGAFAQAKAGALRAALTAENLRWTRKGGDAVSAQVRGTGQLANLGIADLNLRAVGVAVQGEAGFGPQGARADILASAQGRGAYAGLGAPVATDSDDMAAVKRAAANFAFSAPGVRLGLSGKAASASFVQPLRLNPQRGGTVLLASQGRGWRLTAAGGGLPEVQADVARFAFVDGEARASGRIQAKLSIGPVVDGDFDAAGALRIAESGIEFRGERCAAVRAPRLELGENDVENLAARLCPSGAPLLSLRDGGWRIAGRVEGASGSAPFLLARAEDGAGRMDMSGKGERFRAQIDIAGARVIDAAPQTRFHPLRLTGVARATDDVWNADLALHSGQTRVATAVLRNEGRTESGGVQIDTGLLTFAQGGLQPEQLSPMAAAVGSPVEGQARFTGALAWSPAAETSSGTLSIPGLSFTSPAGRLEGLSGEVVFTSLTPLVAAPGQVLKAERLTAIVPLTGVTATFGIEGEALTVSGGEAEVGGGTIKLEALRVPFTPGAPMSGVLSVEGVQLHDLVEASPFGDRVELDAKVSGRIPFEVLNGDVRVRDGQLRAIQPGRLSIQREALTGVSTPGAGAVIESPVTGAAEEVAPGADTFTDFAYQAMENLAFDTLDATINSLPEGRVGVLFHVIGRHDPPQRQQIRLTILDLITRRFMNKELPLPSGTGVNLTLDTTLNLDQLLADFAEYQRLRNSAPVQR
ncbi:intermembrane phospholipid transport protein YdbH family protein [Phenylobacterium deserti]|uniref:Uncharacterized protein n=1 Tax=Phenylobacterium deserti TaxID=1914756 RepID=A0A328ARI9_9CAUL|nr:YdbH domain-containing protein [Phenylobacterium deserti]RAK57570.1 hypothetical protein DJ018_06470 [Phenylobacterium deserti]